MKVRLIKTTHNAFYNEESVKKYTNELGFVSILAEEHIDSWETKCWNLFVEINTINDIEFIQKYFDEEIVIDLNGYRE